MIAELYDALREAGASEERSRAAAQTLADYKERVSSIAPEFEAVRSELRQVRTELKTDIAVFRTELKTDIAGLRTELKTELGELRTEIGGLRTELKGDIRELRTELKGDIKLLQWQLGLLIAGVVALVSKAFFGTH